MGLFDRLFGAAVLEVVGLGAYLMVMRKPLFESLVSNGITVDEVLAVVLGHPDVLGLALVLGVLGLLLGGSSGGRRRHTTGHDVGGDADGGLFDGGDGGGGFGGDGGGGGGGGGE